MESIARAKVEILSIIHCLSYFFFSFLLKIIRRRGRRKSSEGTVDLRFSWVRRSWTILQAKLNILKKSYTSGTRRILSIFNTNIISKLQRLSWRQSRRNLDQEQDVGHVLRGALHCQGEHVCWTNLCKVWHRQRRHNWFHSELSKKGSDLEAIFQFHRYSCFHDILNILGIHASHQCLGHRVSWGKIAMGF